ncbi:serine protease 30-like [Paramacrobiotus metropolitanus]|uniref:serine protease 30-like n=1 Tax=Paramacrobiotus metropolitanus TaxID=2943436 RepID=UPI0024458A99|nr:serine protease 30-like [Paramacrobiotus metropolitanus]
MDDLRRKWIVVYCAIFAGWLNCVFAQTCGGFLANAGMFWYPQNYPGNYPDYAECRWTITVPPGNVVQIQFTEPYGIPGRDFLAVVDGQYANQLGPACSLKDYFALGPQGQAFILIRADKADFNIFTSTTNSLIAVFCAQGQRGSHIPRKGFRAQFFPVASGFAPTPSPFFPTTVPPFFPWTPPPPQPVTFPTAPPVTTAFPWTVAPPPSADCGVPVVQPGQARIIGGHPATLGSWPYMVALVDARYNGQFCGGVLLDQNWVLTAAHCTVDKPAQNLLLRVGATDFNASVGDPARGTDYRAAFSIVNPNFNSQSFSNDIALIRLSTPVTFSTFVKPICMPTEAPSPGTVCYIAGYGLTTPMQRKKRQVSVTASGSSRLMETDVPLVPQSTCQTFFNQAFPGLITLTNSHVCAGSIYPVSHDSCNGDSGGPLICRRQNHFEIVGLTSFGVGCGRSDVFGAYTNVWQMMSWVNSVRGVQSTDQSNSPVVIRFG